MKNKTRVENDYLLYEVMSQRCIIVEMATESVTTAQTVSDAWLRLMQHATGMTGQTVVNVYR